MKFEDIINDKNIYLYLGDLEHKRITYTQKKFIGLSLSQDNEIHIKHDVTKPFLLNNDTVDIVQSEDVFEHI